VRFHARAEEAEALAYARKAKAVVVRHTSGHEVVAMVEIVSPGNKSSRAALASFVRKAQEVLAAGIHLLIIDLFPPRPPPPHRPARPRRPPSPDLGALRRGRLPATPRPAPERLRLHRRPRPRGLPRAPSRRRPSPRDAPLPDPRDLRPRPPRRHLPVRLGRRP